MQNILLKDNYQTLVLTDYGTATQLGKSWMTDNVGTPSMYTQQRLINKEKLRLSSSNKKILCNLIGSENIKQIGSKDVFITRKNKRSATLQNRVDILYNGKDKFIIIQ